MPVSNIIFWLMYITKITIIYINEKLLLFVGGRCHEEGEGGMINFETTHKSISIHVFFICNSQNTMRNASN